jgi:large subunit ribosomal protein L4
MYSQVMEVKVVDFNGKDTGRKVELSDSVFAIEPIITQYTLMLSSI